MEKGIICFETGQFNRRNENEFYALPLLEFLKSAWGINFIYRPIATLQDLRFYFEQIGKTSNKNKYGIVYFSFHGSPENIFLPGSGNIPLSTIMEEAAATGAFDGRHVHFGTCETLDCEDNVIRDLKRNTGAKSISGYTEEVDSISAYINELAYFDQILRYSSKVTIKKHMEDYQTQLEKLGFCIY